MSKEADSLDSQLHTQFRAANDVNTSKEKLFELSMHENEIIRGAVALNPSAPPSALTILLKDPSVHVHDCLRERGAAVKMSEPLAHVIGRTRH
jgi:hypothetical protein